MISLQDVLKLKRQAKINENMLHLKFGKLCLKRNLIKLKESKVKEREIRDYAAHSNQN